MSLNSEFQIPIQYLPAKHCIFFLHETCAWFSPILIPQKHVLAIQGIGLDGM